MGIFLHDCFLQNSVDRKNPQKLQLHEPKIGCAICSHFILIIGHSVLDLETNLLPMMQSLTMFNYSRPNNCLVMCRTGF